jgi:hypothetical protein
MSSSGREELFDNAAFYERIHVKSFIPDISPPLASAIRQCAQIGSYSCTWTMHAASTVILSNNSKNVFNLISDEAFSWPNNTKEMALKRQLPSPLTTIGVESDHC